MRVDFKIRRKNGNVVIKITGDAVPTYRAIVANRRDFQQDDVLEIWHGGKLKMLSNFGGDLK